MRAKLLSRPKTSLLVLPLLAIVLVSGCTWPGTTTTGGTGVVVKEFAPEFSEIYAGEPVTFRLLVKNEGSSNARNAYAELLGLDEDWCGKGNTALTECGTSAGGRLEKWPNEPECSYRSGLAGGFNLLAPDLQRGTSGGSHICTWTYKAPPIQKGFTITYTPTARVYYTYTSGVVKLITFGSSNELRTIQDSGGKLPTETVSATNSPIKLGIETKGPIRFWQDEQKVIFPLEITINNVGGGVACANEGYVGSTLQYACKEAETQKNKIKLRIDFGTNGDKMKLSPECKDFQGKNEGDGKTLSLWKGQSNSIVCEVEASGLSSGATNQRMINVQAIYEYYTDTSSSITVIGRKTSGDFSSGGTGIPSSSEY